MNHVNFGQRFFNKPQALQTLDTLQRKVAVCLSASCKTQKANRKLCDFSPQFVRILSYPKKCWAVSVFWQPTKKWLAAPNKCCAIKLY